jgi:hypothetical protein
VEIFAFDDFAKRSFSKSSDNLICLDILGMEKRNNSGLDSLCSNIEPLKKQQDGLEKDKGKKKNINR